PPSPPTPPLFPYTTLFRSDLALVCDEAVTCGAIEDAIRSASPLVAGVSLFDIYRGKNLGEGKKSMAFSLVLADPKAELAPDQVEDRKSTRLNSSHVSISYA